MDKIKKIKFKEKEKDLLIYDKETPFFTFKGDVHLAKVVKCYDGDTIHCIFNHNNNYYKFRVRMSNYDSPEMKPSKKIPNKEREDIKKRAIQARDRLKELILNKIIVLYCDGEDKYGRLLGTIKLSVDDEKSINDIMVDENHGYIYNGGTKKNMFSKIKKLFNK